MTRSAHIRSGVEGVLGVVRDLAITADRPQWRVVGAELHEPSVSTANSSAAQPPQRYRNAEFARKFDPARTFFHVSGT